MAQPETSLERASEGTPNSRSACSGPALISVCIYAISGPCIILVNKTIIKEHGLNAPALVSSMGILFTAVSTHLAAALGLISITPMKDKSTSVLPIVAVGVCTSLSFLLGNKAYIYLDAGFLQMMKAATPALLMLALIVFRIEKISLGVSFCALLMVGGAVMAAFHTPHLNAVGIVTQLGSQGCEVMQNVMIQFFLQQLSFTALDAGYYIAPMSTLCCFVLSWYLESETITKDGGELVFSQVSWLCASGLVGVAVNFSSFFVIQFVSSLMAKLVVVARSAGLVTVLILVWGEECTSLQIIGYGITLVAFGGYATLKATEVREIPRATKPDLEMPSMGQELDGTHSDEPLMGKTS